MCLSLFLELPIRCIQSVISVKAIYAFPLCLNTQLIISYIVLNLSNCAHPILSLITLLT